MNEHQTDFSKLYCDLILKKIASKITGDQNKKTKAEITSMETAETSSQVRSMRHWRAVGNNEFYYAEINKGFERLKELDEQTGWSSNLHQDRFKFMRDKYSDVLKRYLEEVKCEQQTN